MRPILLALVLLSGCGGAEQVDDNHGYGWHYDTRGIEGMRLRYTPTVEPEEPEARLASYETRFSEVMTCTGLGAEPPLIIIVPDGTLNPLDGIYRPGLVLLEKWGALQLFKHEAVHHLLKVNTGNLDPAHQSDLFKRCG